MLVADVGRGNAFLADYPLRPAGAPPQHPGHRGVAAPRLPPGN